MINCIILDLFGPPKNPKNIVLGIGLKHFQRARGPSRVQAPRSGPGRSRQVGTRLGQPAGAAAGRGPGSPRLGRLGAPAGQEIL